MKEEMAPLPSGIVPEGTLVWGADFNAAVSQLYRWWGALDAPAGTDLTLLRSNLLTLGSPLYDILPSDDPTAHHLDYDAYRLKWINGAEFRLEADYDVQTGDRTDRRALVAILVKVGDGGMLIRSIEERQLATLPARAFEASYVLNRAKATSTRFQAHMDALSGDAAGLRDLLMPQMELHGLVASKADASVAREGPLTDVDDLRNSVAGTATVADNVIRDFAGFQAWFATAPALFSYGLHKLEQFSVEPLPDGRFSTVAQYDWRAETLNGARIETHHPLTWILVDEGGAYMRIEKLLPF